jgi:predicted negative regulator of RcsB-dependent stress response
MRAISEAPRQTTDTQLEVLWVGHASRAREALLRLGVRTHLVRPEQCLQQVATRAPDMLVFSGAAAARAEAIVGELRAHHPGATLPAIVISSEGKPTESPHRRAGIVTRLSAELAPSVIAAEIHERLCRLAALPAQREVSLSWRDIDAWLRSAVEAGSSGILITSAPAGAIALGPNGRVAPSTELLREASTRPLGDQPCAMKLLELPPSRLLVLSEATGSAAAPDIAGARIVVVHPELERGEAVCGELVAAGATAQAIGIGSAEIANVAAATPTLIVIAASALVHASTASLWEDERLASAAWLVLDESELEELPPSQILGAATALVAAGQTLHRRLADGELIVDRIENLGAAGWLKAVGRSEQPRTLVLKGAAGRAELSLTGTRMHAATFVSVDGGASQKGRAALQAALTLPFGKVLAGPHDAVMAHEATLQVEHEPAVDEAKDGPGRSQIRERITVEPDAAPSHTAAPISSFRPSKPSAFGGRAKPAQPSPVATVPAALEQHVPERASPKPNARAGREEQSPAPERPSPAAKAPAAREERAPAPEAPTPAAKPRAAREEHTPAPAPTQPQPSHNGTFDVALARRLAGPPPLAERAASPLPVRVSAPTAARAHAEPPSAASSAPAVSEQRVVPAAATNRPPLVRAPIAPIASELEPRPVARPRPDRPLLPAGKRPRSWAVAVGGAAVAILAALIAITAMEPATQQAQLAAPEATSAAELKAPSQAEQLAPTANPKEPAATSTAPTTERSNEQSEQRVEARRTASEQNTEAPAQGKVVLSRVPRGSEADALLERAKQARGERRAKEAEALIAEVLTRYPNDFEARYYMALTLVTLRRFDEAHAQLAKAMELNHESASAWLLEGDIFLQEGRRPQALHAWKRCIDVAADFSACHQRLARWRAQ